MPEIEHLIEIVAKLRDPEHGCPWDSRQTHLSLRRFLVEECGEFLDAMEEDRPEAMCEELGDILLQIVLHARIAEEQGRFTFEDVAKSESDKMIRRHPHIFGNQPAASEEEIHRRWDAIKAKEKAHIASTTPLDVPRSLPALARAQKFLSRLRQKGISYPIAQEQLTELVADQEDKSAFRESIGNLLLDIAALCQANDCQAEEILQETLRQKLTEYASAPSAGPAT
jgi:MazG family protein